MALRRAAWLAWCAGVRGSLTLSCRNLLRNPTPTCHPWQAAITLLEEPGALPAPGVHTPASLLRGTRYIQRLRPHGISFERVDSAAVQ